MHPSNIKPTTGTHNSTTNPLSPTSHWSSETNIYRQSIISMSRISLHHRSNERCVCWKIGRCQTLFKHTLPSVLWAPCVKSLLIICRRVKGGMRHVKMRSERNRGGVFRLLVPQSLFLHPRLLINLQRWCRGKPLASHETFDCGALGERELERWERGVCFHRDVWRQCNLKAIRNFLN